MFHHLLDRRSFLKISLTGMAMFLHKPCLSNVLSPKKFPEGELLLYNTHTGERSVITYRDHSGKYDPEAFKDLNWILRCHYSGQVSEMDIRVIEFLNLIDKKLGGKNEIHIISGYRSPEYNQLLIQLGRNVSKNSLHLLGKAIDLRIPKVSLSILKSTAVDLRYGGVGYYSQSDFIHLDSGRFRVW